MNVTVDFIAEVITCIKDKDKKIIWEITDNIDYLNVEDTYILFNPQNFNSSTGIKIDEQTNPNDSYKATNNLIALS